MDVVMSFHKISFSTKTDGGMIDAYCESDKVFRNRASPRKLYFGKEKLVLIEDEHVPITVDNTSIPSDTYYTNSYYL